MSIFYLFLQDFLEQIFLAPLKPLLREGYRGGVFNEFIRFVGQWSLSRRAWGASRRPG